MTVVPFSMIASISMLTPVFENASLLTQRGIHVVSSTYASNIVPSGYTEGLPFGSCFDVHNYVCLLKYADSNLQIKRSKGRTRAYQSVTPLNDRCIHQQYLDAMQRIIGNEVVIESEETCDCPRRTTCD